MFPGAWGGSERGQQTTCTQPTLLRWKCCLSEASAFCCLGGFYSTGLSEQGSPTFLTPGTGFMKDNFSMDLSRWMVLR